VTRYTFGGTSADIVTDTAGNYTTDAGTAWTSRTGGTQITDLLDANGSPLVGGTISTLTDPVGLVIFQGPDDGTNMLWVDFGGGRVKMTAWDGKADRDAPVEIGNVPDLSSLYAPLTVSGKGVVRKDELIFNVKDYGAVGDGTTDDAAAFQLWANAVCQYGGTGVIPATDNGYKINTKVQFLPSSNLAPDLPGSDLHFSDMAPVYIRGPGARVTAGAAMTSMFEFIFDTSDTDIAPFRSKVEGVAFDGANLATAAIKSDYSMHMEYVGNSFYRLSRGIEYTGYGVFLAKHNVFKCSYGIYLLGGGGDSTIESNDFYTAANSTSCIWLGYWGGNLTIANNVFTNADGHTGNYGVQMLGSSAAASEEIRHNVISANEFCGLGTAIRADGKATGNRNVWNIVIDRNHVTPYGASNPGQLLAAIDCTDFTVTNNHVNSVRLIDASTSAFDLTRCDRFDIRANAIGAVTTHGAQFTDCTSLLFENNRMTDIGKGSTGNSFVVIWGSATATTRIRGNLFAQSSSSYAQNGVSETTGVNGTICERNEFVTVGVPYVKVGAASVLREESYGTAAPSTGTHLVGAVVWNSAPAASGTMGWVCTTAGTPGTWKTFGAVSA
jgi:hypothetical protein